MSYGVVEQHLQHLRLEGKAEGTVGARRRALVRLRVALGGGELLAATPEQLLAWRERMRLSPVTIGAYVSHARCFYEWARRRGLIVVNPVDELPVPRRPRSLPRPIGEDALMLAMARAAQPVRAWLVLAAWCGLRAKEIALLRRENVRERAAPPVLLVAADATKGRRERIVPLSAFVVRELAPLLPARGWVWPSRAAMAGTYPAVTEHYLVQRAVACCTVSWHAGRNGAAAARYPRPVGVVGARLRHLLGFPEAGFPGGPPGRFHRDPGRPGRCRAVAEDLPGLQGPAGDR